MTDSRLRHVVYSTKHGATIEDYPVADIDRDAVFTDLFARARPYTMTSKEVMFSLYQAAFYVAERGIAGDFVECGVWRGGSALLAGLTWRHFAAQSISSSAVGRRHLLDRLIFAHRAPKQRRRLWLYDTYEGMTPPTARDVDLNGCLAGDYIADYGDNGKWCYADLADVQGTFAAHGFNEQEVRFIKGDVLDTLKRVVPDKISILRLDTDWHASTRLELEVLYPRLVTGGVLIVDDYGHWEGSRKAVDEYFERHPSVLLNRVSYAVRVAVKI